MFIAVERHFWLNSPHLLGLTSPYPGPLCFSEPCMEGPGAEQLCALHANGASKETE